VVVFDRLDRFLDHRPWLAAFSSGVVATLAMPPVFAWPVLFFVFYVVIGLMDRAVGEPGQARDISKSALKRAFWIGWMFGLGYFTFGLYWISASLFVEPDKFLWLLPFSATLIPAGLAVFTAITFAGAALIWGAGPQRIVALALAFTLGEWLRGHLFTGLPWNVVGYALTAPPWFLQSAALFGTYALTFLAVLIFALPAAARDAEASFRGRLTCLGLPVLALAALAVFGAHRLALPEPAAVAGARLRLVQPNVSQDMKWRSENRAEIFRGYVEQSRRNQKGEDDGLAGITHVIWPESAIPFLLLNSQPALEAIAGLLPDGTSLITGAIRVDELAADRRQVYNSLLALDDRARLIGTFDKRHLVPFGEYLPFQLTLEAMGLESLTRLIGSFTAGAAGVRLWNLPGLPAIGPLICYEGIFPDEVVTPGQRPQMFLNVTNDGWFGKTAGPHQHLHHVRVRAVEHGIPLIRVANTGISAVVDARGRILQSAGLARSANIDTSIPGALAATPFSRGGNAWLAMMLGLGGIAWLALRTTSRPAVNNLQRQRAVGRNMQ
jgi:apolipoprotein N-acyltransferase